jgi:hypothetical protein
VHSCRNHQPKNNGSGQLILNPVFRLFTVVPTRFVVILLAAAKLVIVGVPFYEVSFRAFTACPTVEKGTPTAQSSDNRSIAQTLDARMIGIFGSFVEFDRCICNSR